MSHYRTAIIGHTGHGNYGHGTIAGATLFQRGNRRIIVALLDAIENDREPAGSGQRARAALELIQAIAAAHANGGRIPLPLQEREHPFIRHGST